MCQKYLLWCKALIKNEEWLYLQLWQNSLRREWVDWMLPGGRIEEWEGFGDVLCREIYEETNYQMHKENFMYQWTFVTTVNIHWTANKKYWLVLSYYEYMKPIFDEPVLSNKHQQWRRVTMEILKESLYPIVYDKKHVSFLTHT